MNIVFYYKDTDEIIEGGEDWLFVMKNEVYQDECGVWYAEECTVYLDGVSTIRHDIGWRVE